MWNEAVWLNLPKTEIKKWNILQGDLNGRFAYYRCDIELKEKADLRVCITANSRYRFWVNGEPVLSGPCKGDRYRHYYEEVDLSDKLKIGKNVFAVQVLLCDQNAVVHQGDERAPILAVASLPGVHRLAMEGNIVNRSGEMIGNITTGKAPWKVYLDGSFYLKAGDEETIYLGAVKENIDFHVSPADWKSDSYDYADWAEPEKTGTVLVTGFDKKVGFYGSHRIWAREIPLLYEKEEVFSGISELGFVNGIMIIPAGESREIILNAQVHTNAYLKYCFEKGKGAEAEITYAEKYFSQDGTEIKRTDCVNGILKGITDKIVLNGEPLTYEPFWYRTFRFIRICIRAGEEDVIFHEPIMRKTGYPLEIQSEIRSDSENLNKLWEICVRTLQNCMTETYMDCPFYEQMQFSMDTRLQMLFNYVVSKDVRLAKKALKDFHCSMIPDGLIQGKYPSGFPQIISTFSLHYIFMLEEYYRQTLDLGTLRRYRADVDTMLEYFDRHIGSTGLVEDLDYWQFVDWQSEWKDTMGMPTAAETGPSVIINLMYACALQSGAYIYEVTGRKGTAQEYRERQQEILSKVQELCWDEEKGLYREGPKVRQFSQHAQAWAVLNGIVSKEEAKLLLKRTLNDPEVLQCSFSTGYELFRAFEWAECYEDTQLLMEKWIRLIEWECTTCPEEPENGRSECHAWSALPIFEIIRGIAGIRMSEDGWKTAEIKPDLYCVEKLSGKAVTPKGIIEFAFDKTEGTYYVCLPEGMRGRFILDSEVMEIKGGEAVSFRN